MAKMLVTRPEPDASETADHLRALGIEAVAAPLLRRATLHVGLPDAKGFAALALTSANALRALEERHALLPFLGLPVYAVGERTADAAKAAGFTVVANAGGTMQHLVEKIAEAQLKGPVFYPAARHQSADLARALAPFAIMVVTAKVYEMRAATSLPPELLASLAAGEFAAALFYSRRTAEIFVELVGGAMNDRARAGLAVLCLSEQVAEPLLAARFVRVALADYPSAEAMASLALAFVRGRNTA